MKKIYPYSIIDKVFCLSGMLVPMFANNGTMQKLLFSFLLSFLIFPNALAQKELWGYRGYENGAIIKTPLEGSGSAAVVMHTFDIDGATGKFPKGRLFQASNGKLYGITSFRSTEGDPNGVRGVLFSYDLVTNEYIVLSTTLIEEKDGNLGGVIEPVPGILYGTTNGGNSIFKYDIANGTGSIAGSIPAFYYNDNPLRPRIRGELMKASDGYIYCVTDMAPSVQDIPYPGGIYRFNLVTNQFTRLYYFGTEPSDGNVRDPEFDTQLIEALPGKLYGTSKGGSHFGPDGVASSGSGTLFEFTIATNTVIKKYDFDYISEGIQAVPVTKSGNKLYGALFGQNNSGASLLPNPYGIFYEYDLGTETLTFMHSIGFPADGVLNPIGRPLMGSNGRLYGASQLGNYEYDINADQVNEKIDLNYYEPMALIEVCRKPSYKPSEVTAFTICAGSPFSFDLQNDNAATFVWKKSGVVLPLQTSGVLNFTAIATADSGTYSCEMANECGITVTPSFTITVNPANSSTVYSSIPSAESTVMICPDSTVILSGNDFTGTWNTGETTPTLVVSEAGQYFITNTNSCGNTYSNIITVGIYDTLPPINISYDPGTTLCPGGPITFTGNIGGTWEDGSTGESLTTTIDTNTAHFVTRSNECGTITSNMIQFHEDELFDVNIIPEIMLDGAPSVCVGGSVVLYGNIPGTWYRTDPILSYMGQGDSFEVTSPGTYILERVSYCFGTVTSEPVVILLSTEAPGIPHITIENEPAPEVLLVCDGEVITLESDGENNLWSTGETTNSIEVSAAGNFNVLSRNGCGSEPSAYINVIFVENPSTEVTQNANSLTAAETFIWTYQWVTCGPDGETTDITGANQQSFTATGPGSYAVRLVNFYSCERISDCFTVTVEDLGVPTISGAKGIVLFPNPAQEKIFLQTDLAIGHVSVTNMLGQVVLETNGLKEIDIARLPAGCYLLAAGLEKGIWFGKFIKK